MATATRTSSARMARAPASPSPAAAIPIATVTRSVRTAPAQTHPAATELPGSVGSEVLAALRVLDRVVDAGEGELFTLACRYGLDPQRRVGDEVRRRNREAETRRRRDVDAERLLRGFRRDRLLLIAPELAFALFVGRFGRDDRVEHRLRARRQRLDLPPLSAGAEVGRDDDPD